MGCDIHCYAERKPRDKYIPIAMGYEWFGGRTYGRFAWMANVRNYSAVIPFGQTEVPKTYASIGRGIPEDAGIWVKKEFASWHGDAHSASWLYIEELLAFDYEKIMEDRRVTRSNDGGCTCEPGCGQMKTYREFLGPTFFDEINQAKEKGAERIVFWFDN